jgi:hypothetical protein
MGADRFDLPDHVSAYVREQAERARAAQHAVDEITGVTEFTGSSTIGVSKQMARIVVEVTAARAARTWNVRELGISLDLLRRIEGEIGNRDEVSREDLIIVAARLCAEVEKRDQAAARQATARQPQPEPPRGSNG